MHFVMSKKYLIIAVLWLMLGASFAAPQTTPKSDSELQLEAANPQQLLKKADQARNPDQAFRFNNSLTEYQGATVDYVARFSIRSKTDPKGGQYRNLVTFVAPLQDTGKELLMDGSVMWFYDPSSSATVRVSPQERLQGQVSNGDVLTLNLNLDYKVNGASLESVKDAQKQVRQAFKLLLTASSDIATYFRVEYWIDVNTYLPIKGRYFSDSNRLLKTIYFDKNLNVLGGMRPTELIVIDEFDLKHITRMELSNFEAVDIPDVWFQRQYLSQH